MTRHLPPDALQSASTASSMPRASALGIFAAEPPWMVEAALAALADLRPALGLAIERRWLAAHLWQWPRDDAYFLGVCALLKRYGVEGES